MRNLDRSPMDGERRVFDRPSEERGQYWPTDVPHYVNPSTIEQHPHNGLSGAGYLSGDEDRQHPGVAKSPAEKERRRAFEQLLRSLFSLLRFRQC